MNWDGVNIVQSILLVAVSAAWWGERRTRKQAERNLEDIEFDLNNIKDKMNYMSVRGGFTHDAWKEFMNASTPPAEEPKE